MDMKVKLRTANERISRLEQEMNILRVGVGAVIDVLLERRRQINDELHTPTSDMHYEDGELSRAAAAYAVTAPGDPHCAFALWPWAYHEFKPKDRRRNLVRAAALLIAEIERFDKNV